ncbi:MAG: acetoacetate decarboxylase [Betaproteobacteria bacterium]|nr:acetoacetate decarboxylase [Betaproteobacteria bacterium]
MKKSDVLKLPSMPLQSPTFPRGPYRFFRRQYLVVSYQSDAAAIREALPEPLVPAGDTVAVQWLDLPDGEGFGAYSAAAQIIPCTFKGEPCNFVSQMYVDNTPPLAGGREIWGYPMKYGKAVLKVTGDTLTGTLDYATQRAATGTMVYKHDAFRADLSKEKELLARTQVTLKMIPDIDGTPAIAQLVGINFADVKLHGAWTGEARLELIPAVNCPLADLPVRRVTGGLHMVTDMTLPYGRVLHDYLA